LGLPKDVEGVEAEVGDFFTESVKEDEGQNKNIVMTIGKVGESLDVVSDRDRREFFGVEGSHFRDLLNGGITSTISGDDVFNKKGK